MIIKTSLLATILVTGIFAEDMGTTNAVVNVIKHAITKTAEVAMKNQTTLDVNNFQGKSDIKVKQSIVNGDIGNTIKAVKTKVSNVTMDSTINIEQSGINGDVGNTIK